MRDPTGRVFGSMLEAMSAITIRFIAATTVGFLSGVAGAFLSNLRGWGCGQAGDARGITTEQLLWRSLRGGMLNAALSYIGQVIDEGLEAFDVHRLLRFAVAIARNLFSYFVGQRAAGASNSRTGVIMAVIVTVIQAAYETGFDAVRSVALLKRSEWRLSPTSSGRAYSRASWTLWWPTETATYAARDILLRESPDSRTRVKRDSGART